MSFQDTLKSFHKQQIKLSQSGSSTPRTSNFVEQIENMKNKKENTNLTDILHEEEQTEKEISNVVDRLKLLLSESVTNNSESCVAKQGIVAKIAEKPITPRKPRKPKI